MQSICKREWIADPQTGIIYSDRWFCALASTCTSFDIQTQQLAARVSYSLCNQTAVSCSCPGISYKLLL
jgi:hypothetical protein